MNHIELLLRQQRLQIRSAQLRDTLSQDTRVIQSRLHVIDDARAGLQWLYKNPIYPSIALVALALLKPRRALTWGKYLWTGWLTFQRLRLWLSHERAD